MLSPQAWGWTGGATLYFGQNTELSPQAWGWTEMVDIINNDVSVVPTGVGVDRDFIL